MRSHMTLPGRIDTERQLESALAQPSDADVESISRLDGDILILGAGGKMGPSLARRIQQAVGESGSRTRVWAASRFSSGAVRASLESAGIETLACDLLDREQVAALPDCRHVLFLAGRKFGTLGPHRLDVDHQHGRSGTRGGAVLSIAHGRVLDRQRVSAGAGRWAGSGRRPAPLTRRRICAVVPRARTRDRVRLARDRHARR